MQRVTRFIPFVLLGAWSLSCEPQPVSAPRPPLARRVVEPGPNSQCLVDRDKDKKDAPVRILCAMTVTGNPLSNVAKGWFSNKQNAYYIADQSNSGVDIMDLKAYAYAGRIPGFVGVATSGGGTSTTNGQGPNSMALAEGHHMWVSDGNSQVRLVDLQSKSIVATVSTALTACDGGIEGTHYCGRTNEMTYDPKDHIVIVVNPNPLNRTPDAAGIHAPLPPYVSFIDGHAPYAVLGTIAFPEARGTPEAPVWNPETKRFLLPVPTCNSAATCAAIGANGAREDIVVINPKTLSVETRFQMPDCGTIFSAPVPFGMMNDMSIDVKHQHVIMPACGRGEIVFDARTGAVVNVVSEIAGSDQTWFNEGDGNFYVAANDPNNANIRSLGVIDGRTGRWQQNVPAVGAVIPSASDDPWNRVFTTVPASAGTTACTSFGVAASGCVIVYEHEDGKPSKKD